MLPWLLWAGAGGPVFTEFTITSGIAGQGYWYNRRSGFSVGSATGDLVVPGVGTINRIGISSGDVLINRGMQLGGFGAWVLANPGYSITLTFLDDSNAEIVLTSAEQDGTPGGGFIRFGLTADQLTTVDNVFVGARIRVKVDPSP